MEIAFHLGVHCTDDDALIQCLLANAERLAAEGVMVPRVGNYRLLLRETMHKLRGAPASGNTEQMLLDSIIESADPRRLVLSWWQFPGPPAQVISGGVFYPEAGPRSQALRLAFPSADVSFHLGLRNPATLVPALAADPRTGGFASFMAGADPMRLFWSEMIQRLREANPEAPITVWCDEDTPLIWPEVLQAVAGHSDTLVLDRLDDRLAGIMTGPGFEVMRNYMAKHPPQDVVQRRRMVSAFLDKFLLDEDLPEDLPGWDEAAQEAMTEYYEEDMERVAAIEGVRLIEP